MSHSCISVCSTRRWQELQWMGGSILPGIAKICFPTRHGAESECTETQKARIISHSYSHSRDENMLLYRKKVPVCQQPASRHSIFNIYSSTTCSIDRHMLQPTTYTIQAHVCLEMQPAMLLTVIIFDKLYVNFICSQPRTRTYLSTIVHDAWCICTLFFYLCFN